MGLYSRYVFPWFLERTLSTPEVTAERIKLLKSAQGRCLEIGAGTGLNLPHYPKNVEELSILDRNPGMNSRCSARIKALPFPSSLHQLNAETLPFEDHTFDTVVSTWTLCSIPAVETALSEIKRVLKPSGRFLFLEHGLSRDPKVAKWQFRLDPLSQIFADGCHITRDIRALVKNAGFKVEGVEEYYFPGLPLAHGYFYRGNAQLPS